MSEIEEKHFPNREEMAEFDLWELLSEIRRHFLLVLFLTVLGGIGGGCISKFLLNPFYRSTTRMYVMSENSTLTALANLQLGTQLTSDYTVLVTGRTVMEDVIQQLNLNMGYGQLRQKIRLNNPKDTRILDITVTDNDPERAKLIADALATSASNFIADIMEQDPPKIIETGEIPSQKAGPSHRKNITVGALLGLGIALGGILLKMLADDKIKTEGDVEETLGVNVLASLPLLPGQQKKNRKRSLFGKKKEGR